jgi:hypothetical protein
MCQAHSSCRLWPPSRSTCRLGSSGSWLTHCFWNRCRPSRARTTRCPPRRNSKIGPDRMLGRLWQTQILLRGSLHCKRGTKTALPIWCTCQPGKECKQRPFRRGSRTLFICVSCLLKVVSLMPWPWLWLWSWLWLWCAKSTPRILHVKDQEKTYLASTPRILHVKDQEKTYLASTPRIRAEKGPSAAPVMDETRNWWEMPDNRPHMLCAVTRNTVWRDIIRSC